MLRDLYLPHSTEAHFNFTTVWSCILYHNLRFESNYLPNMLIDLLTLIEQVHMPIIITGHTKTIDAVRMLIFQNSSENTWENLELTVVRIISQKVAGKNMNECFLHFHRNMHSPSEVNIYQGIFVVERSLGYLDIFFYY